jgi:hypothetical protein
MFNEPQNKKIDAVIMREECKNYCDFYCLSFNNFERKQRMTKLFNSLNISCRMSTGVSKDDPRILKNLDPSQKRVWSCMYGHLDMIRDFYENSNNNVAVFCEDDIKINKNLKTYLPQIIVDFADLNLDVLLLGYLAEFKIKDIYKDFSLVKELHYMKEPLPTLKNIKRFKYHNYNETIWGTQMYMISKTYAKFLLDTYSRNYAEISIIYKVCPFSADWIITKKGKRALMTPIMAIEDGCFDGYKDEFQKKFHENCYKTHFEKEEFI